MFFVCVPLPLLLPSLQSFRAAKFKHCILAARQTLGVYIQPSKTTWNQDAHSLSHPRCTNSTVFLAQGLSFHPKLSWILASGRLISWQHLFASCFAPGLDSNVCFLTFARKQASLQQGMDSNEAMRTTMCAVAELLFVLLHKFEPSRDVRSHWCGSPFSTAGVICNKYFQGCCHIVFTCHVNYWKRIIVTAI